MAMQIEAKKQLFNYGRVLVQPGETGHVIIEVSGDDFQVAMPTTGDLAVIPGTYALDFTDGSGNAATVDVVVAGAAPYLVERFPSK